MNEVLVSPSDVEEITALLDADNQCSIEQSSFPKLDGILFPVVVANAEVVAPCRWMGGVEVSLTAALNNYYQSMTEENADEVIADVYEFLSKRVDQNQNQNQDQNREEEIKDVLEVIRQEYESDNKKEINKDINKTSARHDAIDQKSDIPVKKKVQPQQTLQKPNVTIKELVGTPDKIQKKETIKVITTKDEAKLRSEARSKTDHTPVTRKNSLEKPQPSKIINDDSTAEPAQITSPTKEALQDPAPDNVQPVLGPDVSTQYQDVLVSSTQAAELLLSQFEEADQKFLGQIVEATHETVDDSPDTTTFVDKEYEVIESILDMAAYETQVKDQEESTGDFNGEYEYFDAGDFTVIPEASQGNSTISVGEDLSEVEESEVLIQIEQIHEEELIDEIARTALNLEIEYYASTETEEADTENGLWLVGDETYNPKESEEEDDSVVRRIVQKKLKRLPVAVSVVAKTISTRAIELGRSALRLHLLMS